MKFLILLIALMSAFPALAVDVKVKVHFDCYLSNDWVDCVDLKQGYFGNKLLIDTASAEDADLNLTIRVTYLNNESEYQVTTKWRDGNELPLGYRLNSTISEGEFLEKLLLFLRDVTKPYISIANGGANPNSAPEVIKPYYINPNLSAAGNKQQGYTNFTGSAEVTGNYSDPKWRLMGSTYGNWNYSNTKRTAFNPGISSNITAYGGSAGIIRSIKDNSLEKKGQWDVAIFMSDRTVRNTIEVDGNDEPMPENSLANSARKTVIRVGVEWIAIPFLTETSSGNVAVRYSVSGEHHKYVDPESFQYIQETFSRHLLEVYVAKHYPKIDLGLGVGAFATTFRQKPMSGVNGGIELNYKVNPRLTIGANASVQYTKNRIFSTAENPQNTSFSGLTSDSTPLTYSGQITLSYTIGSIRLFNKEQRWKN